MVQLTDRLCGQPVSWGINYLPGWGVQLSADQVLADMRRAGLTATEFQPGLFPAEPETALRLFDAHSLRCVGGWAPLVFHGQPLDDVVAEFAKTATFLRSLGATVATIAAVTPGGDFDTRVELSEREWNEVLTGLDAVSEAGRDRGIRCVLHPHVGTAVETPADIARVIDGSDIEFCLDIGHIFCGGGDPVTIAQQLGDRIGHVHLKDVDTSIAEPMIAGETPWAAGVYSGVFTPLGQGDIDFDAIFRVLGEIDYDGWFVIEQDKRLHEDSPAPFDDVEVSVRFLTAMGSR
ncbi:TIM barrel protein [Saccharopolyspora phatthalungensis]|uniref:Inosose dehydratase n=1 Tax=Saccharopolyspora phatthalungensis TaxID=664693 RepID=A0A840QGY4_9PSEU|nr:TIM barrel protein [Saccharopolyspora phatthalungensis]MBB5159230.1 inosose dehydratase [Saccharopolyspora phatthalungensis]